MVSPVGCSAHNVGMVLDILWVLGYFPPNGFYWSGFTGHSYHGTYRDTLRMDTGMTAYWSGRWPYPQAKGVLSDWLVVNPNKLPASLHEMFWNGPPYTRLSTSLHILYLVCTPADSPGRLPPILCCYNWNPPLISLCELTPSGSSWYWILHILHHTNPYNTVWAKGSINILTYISWSILGFKPVLSYAWGNYERGISMR